MRKLHTFLFVFLLNILYVSAQELYIMTEPASNMAANSFGIRLTNKLMPMSFDKSYSYRLEPELMMGLSKNFMIHGNLYASNMFTKKFMFEGGSVYGKYRFLSVDNLHSHFRMAASGKVSIIKNPGFISHTKQHYVNNEVHEETYTIYSDELEPDGNNSGFNAGIIATQLLHKLAISGTAAYNNRWKNISSSSAPGISNHMMSYSLSAGYLLLPKTYKNYKQTNLNLYTEFMAGSSLDKKGSFIDIAPGIQFIFNSISRIDIAYRTQFAGNMNRFNTSSWLLRYEYYFLNALSKKQQ
ncbi:MAG: hypothetical protein QM763_05680 [Agriterribacter sp.]